MLCPNCHALMSNLELGGHLGRSVTVDVCNSCQSLWFDKYESLQLSAASVLKLFRVIGHDGGVKAALSRDAACPRCARTLRITKDMQRSTRFEYRGCPDNHGRLITFFNFLREKDFIRPLSPAQLEDLRRNLSTVNCSNCGAPVDLAKGGDCAHCGSPLSMLDMKQAGELVARLQAAGQGPQPVDRAALPMDLKRLHRDVTTAFESFRHSPGWYDDVSTEGLVGAALGAFAAWISTDT
jgi:hypothetical protein